MKTIFTSACLLLFTSMASSQSNWVTLQDPNFAKAIQAILPSSVNEALQLDTSAIEVKTLTYLSVNEKNIQSIDGIHYFKNLKNFSAEKNAIAYLSTVVWPSQLEELYLRENALKYFPQHLPSTVQRLDVSNNQIEVIPNGNLLPADLYVLSFSFNPVTLSPDLSKLTKLAALDFTNTNITYVKNLPNSLEQLQINDGEVQFIDRLPSNLKYLYAQNNHLEQIKTGGLPSQLEEADFTSNDLVHVPENHSPRLQSIRLDYNQLVDFVLDSTQDIQYVSCNYNKIKELHALPKNVNTFYINHNELTSLPETIPGNRLKFMECTYNFINKIPNVYFGRGYTSFIGNYNCITEPRIFTDLELTIGKFGYVEKPDRADCDLVTKSSDQLLTDIKTYPNPIQKQVAFTSAAADLEEIKILNDQGRLLIQIFSYVDGSSIDLQNLPQGIYFAVLKSKDKTSIQKIIKE